MISYLVEATLFVALVVTAWRVTRMHRELRKLRQSEAEFARITTQMIAAFDNISATVHDLSTNGVRLVHLLGVRIDEAHRLTREIDTRGGGRGGRGCEATDRRGRDAPPAPFAAAGPSNI